MQRTIKCFITRGESCYVGECHEVNVVTQGDTIDSTIRNLQEAVDLFLDGEDPAEYGLVNEPTLLVTVEVEPLAHAG